MTAPRTVAALLLAAASVALILAAVSTWRTLANLPEDVEGAGDAAPAEVAAGGDADAAFGGEALPWLAIFGVPEAPEPEPSRTEPPEAAPEFPYRLIGVIAAGKTRSAILSGPEGDILAEEGDVLDDAEIVAIEAESIVVDLAGTRRTITFSEEAPVETARLSLEDADADPSAGTEAPMPKPEPQDVIFQRMSRAELLDVLREAERKRKERGLVPVARD